jgi:HK97 family phage portal protein
LLNFIKNILGSTQKAQSATNGIIDVDKKEHIENITYVEIDAFAARLAIEYISTAISVCEFRIFIKGKESFGTDYYDLNVSPNLYQSSADFKRAIASALLADGEVLIISYDKQLFIADSFNLNTSNPLKPFFEKVMILDNHQINKAFAMSEVVYIKHNDGNIRSYLRSIMTVYGELMTSAMDGYKTSGGQKGVLEITAQEIQSENFAKNYETLTNERFSKFLKNRNAVLPLFDGYKYVPQPQADKKTNEISDFNSLKDNAVALAAAAFKIPAGILKGDYKSNVEELNMFITLCLNPWAEIIGQGFCRSFINPTRHKAGDSMFLETTRFSLTNVFAMSSQIDKVFSSGILCQDEIRRKFREPSLGTAESSAYYVTKNYEKTGGENSSE